VSYDIVPGRGNKNAKLVFIGEAPGPDEFQSGRPFTGQSGQMLSRLLGHNTLLESDVYIDNVIQHKTAGRNPNFEEIKLAIPELRRRLMDLPNANCFVAIGNVALEALSVFAYSGVTKYRGSILPARLLGRKMVPIVHPAWIAKDGNREFRYFHVSISDIARAKIQSEFPEIRRPARNHRILYSFDEAIIAIRSLKGKLWAFDLETSLPCLGFALSTTESFTIPFASELYPYIWPTNQRAFLLQELKEVFTKDAKIITQNGFFDKRVLWKDYGIDPTSWNIHADTMWYHQLLYNELPHSLAFIGSIYTEEPYYKDEGREWKRGRDSETTYFTYNGKDCCVTLESFFGLEQEAEEIGQKAYFHEVIMPLEPVLWKMHQDGIWVDPKQLAEVKAELSRKILIEKIKMHHSVGFETNPRSPLDMEFLLNFLKIPEREIVRSEKTGKVSTNEDYLQRLYGRHGHPALLECLALRKSLHLQSGFTNLECDTGGRFHSIFKIGPKSGRLACSGDENGPQLQNIPLPLRRIFAAPNGRTFVELDLEQADTRVLAYDIPEPMLIAMFESEDPDIHSQVCSEIFGIPRKEINKHGPHAAKRKISKEVGHGSNYGMGPRRLVTTLRENGIFIQERQAKEFQASYFSRFGAIRGSYHPYVQERIRKTRSLHDLNGRKHLFLGFLDDTCYREAYSRIPQGTVAGVMMIGMRKLFDEFQSHEWPKGIPLILVQVHDSLVVECSTDDVVEVARLMEQSFSIVLNARGRDFTIPMEIVAGTHWGKLECLDRDGSRTTSNIPKKTKLLPSITTGVG